MGLLAAFAGSGSSASEAATASAATTIAMRTMIRARGLREAADATRRSMVELAITHSFYNAGLAPDTNVFHSQRRAIYYISSANCTLRRASHCLKCNACF